MWTMQQLREKYPRIDLGGSDAGKWIVMFCSYGAGIERGERFDSYWTAQNAYRLSCGCACCGPKYHQLLEIAPAPATFKPTGRVRELGWE